MKQDTVVFCLDVRGYRQGGNGRTAGLTLRRVREGPAAREEEALRCFNCGHEVTYEGQRISIQDQHEHTFVNPGGYVFRVGCFRQAPGCLRAGEPTLQHTWFSGYSWCFALCESCLTHLGWAYESDGSDRFFGLILDRLVSS